MANTNGDGKWFARLVVGFMFTALTIMGGALWSVSSKADEQSRADIKAIEEHMQANLETKEAHDQDVELIDAKFEFIKEQLMDIKEAVKQ